MATKSESGVQLLARLNARPDLSGWEPTLFGASGPERSSLIEFYGEEGTGKTQTTLHLIASALLPRKWYNVDIGGRDTGVVVIDTDYNCCLLRLASIMENKISLIIAESISQGNTLADGQIHQKPPEDSIDALIKECLSKLYVVRCNSTAQMIMFLYSLDTLMNSNPNIGVLIIDSISAFYWMDRSVLNSNVSGKNSPQQQLLLALKRIINMYKISAIVVRAAAFSAKNKESDHGVHEPSQSERWNYMGRQWQQAITMSYTFTSVDVSMDQLPKYCIHFSTKEDPFIHKRHFYISSCGVQVVS